MEITEALSSGVDYWYATEEQENEVCKTDDAAKRVIPFVATEGDREYLLKKNVNPSKGSWWNLIIGGVLTGVGVLLTPVMPMAGPIIAGAGAGMVLSEVGNIVKQGLDGPDQNNLPPRGYEPPTNLPPLGDGPWPVVA